MKVSGRSGGLGGYTELLAKLGPDKDITLDNDPPMIGCTFCFRRTR